MRNNELNQYTGYIMALAAISAVFSIPATVVMLAPSLGIKLEMFEEAGLGWITSPWATVPSLIVGIAAGVFALYMGLKWKRKLTMSHLTKDVEKVSDLPDALKTILMCDVRTHDMLEENYNFKEKYK
jgi:hypothetical protein